MSGRNGTFPIVYFNPTGKGVDSINVTCSLYESLKDFCWVSKDQRQTDASHYRTEYFDTTFTSVFGRVFCINWFLKDFLQGATLSWAVTAVRTSFWCEFYHFGKVLSKYATVLRIFYSLINSILSCLSCANCTWEQTRCKELIFYDILISLIGSNRRPKG